MSMPPHPPAYDLRSTTLTPYLQLPHRLSLVWLAYPILSLLFVVFRLQISSDSAQNAVDNAKGDLLASCRAAEQAATAAASMPRYMAVATNTRIAEAVNGTMNGARAALILALTVMEAIINFIVDLYRSTFLCFLELVVRGGLSILIGAVQELNDIVEGSLNAIRSSIQDDIKGANDLIQSTVNAINKVNPFKDLSAPQIPVPDLSSLQNVTLPPDFENALVKLNDSLPTLSELKDTVNNLLDTPFEAVKKDINETFSGLSFDASTLPVPEQNTVSFCADMDTSVVDDLGHDLIKVAKIGTIILIVLVLLLVAGNCALEWYKWRCLKSHMRYTREAWSSNPAIYHPGGKTGGAPTLQLSDHNLLMLEGDMQHPLLTKIANRISALLRLKPSQHIHLSWFFHYIFHPPALACFLIGFVGLLSVELQLVAIAPLEHKYSAQAAVAVTDFSNTIATSINASMYNQSAAYASDINGRVDLVQSTVNDGLFGWVNGTTTTLNNTVNGFYSDIQNAVSTVFNGTILESPVQEFIRCFIGSKVDAIENALTFLHDNLNIDIPRVNDTVLVLSPDDVNEATRPIATAAIGGGDGDNQGVIGKVVNAYVSSLKKERIMFIVFIALWLFVVLMALAVIFWHSYGRDWLEAYKKKRWQKKQRSGIDGVIVPFRDFSTGGTTQGHHVQGGDVEKVDGELHSFSPINAAPPPKPSLFSNLRVASFAGKDSTPAATPYPLGGNKPGFNKSWESFLDASSAPQTQETQDRPKISGPRRLMSLGRSNSKDTPDQDKETKLQEMPWLTRFTTKVWRRPPKDEDNEEVDEKSSVQERVRPQLTVTTSNGVVEPIDGNTEWAAPSSAWSVSPRKSTWMPNLSPPKLPQVIRPGKPRRTASVPVDIEPAEGQTTMPEPKIQTAFALPLHHGFSVKSTPLSPPPPNFQLTPFTSPTPTYTNHHLSPPILPSRPNATTTTDTLPRLLTSSHKRHQSESADPFATPFDDERYAVPFEAPSPAAAAGKGTSTNPFITVAL